MLQGKQVLKNKYEILRKIGSGGMSSVWLAKEMESSKLWAVKDIDKTSKEFKAVANENNSLSEVEIVRNLNHPYIPHVNDVFEDDESIQIVMEYVEGKTVREIMSARGAIPEHLAVQIMKELVEVFIYLHTRPSPVIYRDLKPGNIMIQSDGHIRLIDFGIAVEIKEGKEIESLGTKGFAAPEQFKGKADARSDIFTMGATLYCMLTENVPKGKSPRYDDVLDINPQTDLRLVQIIEKSTQPEPEDRYQNASELLKDLVTYKEKKSNHKLKVILVVIPLIVALIFAASAYLLHSQISNKAEQNQDNIMLLSDARSELSEVT